MALTGTEAVSNGVPAFKPPEARNAQTVIALMGTFFGLIFLGMSFLAGQLGILPDPTEQETVVSQLTATLVGAGSPFHYLVQVSTAVLLVLAANTSFADFPRLSSILARDGFLPRVFQFRGDRLAFNAGIVVLAAAAVVLIVAFGGSVSESDPAVHGRRVHRFHPQPIRAWSGTGGGSERATWLAAASPSSTASARVTTGVVAIEVAASKFVLGRVDRADPHPRSDRRDAVHPPAVPRVRREAGGPPMTSSSPRHAARSASSSPCRASTGRSSGPQCRALDRLRRSRRS